MPATDDAEYQGRSMVRLRADDGTEAWIDSENGFNVSRIVRSGRDLILCDPARRTEGRTYAVPILYPTPNRVRGDRFAFAGANYPGRMHGIAFIRPFSVTRRFVGDGSASLTGVLDFPAGSREYERFPWDSVLSVTVEVSPGVVRWSYSVRNRDRRPLPYGFALHPFFIRHGRTLVRLSASRVMEAGPDKLPTGRLIPVAGTTFDLRSGAEASSLDLDEVYFDDERPISAEVRFPDAGLSLDLSASREFTHAVVYCPAGKDFLCVENQTCSTDAHNLDAAGFVREANLLVVPSGGTREGWVELRISEGSAELPL